VEKLGKAELSVIGLQQMLLGWSRARWDEHVARMVEMRNVLRILARSVLEQSGIEGDINSKQISRYNRRFLDELILLKTGCSGEPLWTRHPPVGRWTVSELIREFCKGLLTKYFLPKFPFLLQRP
jgi:hypothetical protein